MLSINKLTVKLLLIVGSGFAVGYLGLIGHSLYPQRVSMVMAILEALTAWGLATAVMLLIIRRHHCAIRSMTRQVEQLDRDQRYGLIMIDENDELIRLSGALNRYLIRLQFQARQDQDWLRELNIRVDVAEAEKRQSEAIFYSIAEAVIVVDPHGELLLANPTAEEIFGFSHELNYREPIEDIVDDADLLALIQQVQTKQSSSCLEALERQHPITGKMLTLKVLSSCVKDDNDQPVGIVVIIHDISSELEMSRMKDDIINSVSHEFKTPLASIRAYAELLADNEAQSPEAALSFCEIIQEQSLRLNRMIDNILNLSKIEAGRWRMNQQKLNVKALIDDVIFMMTPQLKDKSMTVRIDPVLESVTMDADQDMMFQVFANLIGNAIKYSPENRTIYLRGGMTPEGDTMVEVEDEGFGIALEEQDRIFEKFYRGQTHSAEAGGSGLGLNLVHQIVQTAHQGKISLKSVPGQGSCFRITIPAAVPVHPTDSMIEQTLCH